MDENSPPPTNTPIAASLSLPKTGLQVQGNDLVKLGAREAVTMRLPLSEIEAVKFTLTFEPISLIFLGMGLGLGLIGHFASPYDWLSTVLYIATVLLVGFGIMGWMCYRIQIISQGETIGVACNDLPEEGRGFVSSLRLLLRMSKKGGAMHVAPGPEGPG
jgi:hypothetical protein